MTPKAVHWRNVRHHKELYLFVLPTLVLLGLFVYYPAGSGIFHSFFRWNGSDVSEPVGLGNYADLVRTTAFWDSFKVALLLGAWNVVKMIPALLVAVCIHRCRSARIQFFYRAMFVIPMVIPMLVTVLIWRSFFFEASTGYLNRFLVETGILNALAGLDRVLGWGGVFDTGRLPVWLGDPRLILTACVVWGFPWVGSFAVLTHLAKLQGISKDIYEAAAIDGVNWWTKFTRVELPLLAGSIHILLVFVIIDTLKDAGMVLALAGMEGGPGGKATVPALFMIRKAFLEQQMGYACAVGVVLTVIVMSLQKVATTVINWEESRTYQKIVVRLAGFAGGALLIYPAGLWWIGVPLLAISLPWQGVFGGVVCRMRKALRATRSNGAAAETDLRRIRFGAKDRKRCASVDHPHAYRLGVFSLRAMKHLTIWGVLMFALVPLYLTIVVSLKTNHQFYSSPTVPTVPLHPENWLTAWNAVSPSLANSVFLAVSSTILTLFCALCAAYFFARYRMPLASFLWDAIIILMMMPAVANLVPLFELLSKMNLVNTLTALILVSTAAGQVFALFVLRNFVADIPQDLFEAAEIDGANHFRQMRTVVLPLVGPILGTVGIMHFLHSWNEFVLPLIVIRDSSRLPVMVQLLRMDGEYIRLMGPLMAGYAIASIPIIILFLFSMRLFVRGLTEGAVKG